MECLQVLLHPQREVKLQYGKAGFGINAFRFFIIVNSQPQPWLLNSIDFFVLCCFRYNKMAEVTVVDMRGQIWHLVWLWSWWADCSYGFYHRCSSCLPCCLIIKKLPLSKYVIWRLYVNTSSMIKSCLVTEMIISTRQICSLSAS